MPKPDQRGVWMPASSTPNDITLLLQRADGGDPEATQALLSTIYVDLRRIARARLRGERAETLTTTALVHEAWLGMAHGRQAQFASRQHYFAYAAKAMRHVLVDRARRRMADKRQSGAWAEGEAHGDDAVDLLAIDQALERLSALSSRLFRVVELRLFTGLSSAEIGVMLELTERTVERDWLKARALLSQWLLEGA